MNHSEVQNLLVLGGILFALGLIGFLTRRSLILMFLSLETMLSGVSLNLIVFSRYHQNYQGQILAVMVLTIAACEAAIALAMVVSLYRRKSTLDVQAWDELSETILPKDSEGDYQGMEKEEDYPRLTPAGLDPLAKPISSSLQATMEQTASEQQTKTSPLVSEVNQRA
ncbi:MAG: NADH-quinone oxidoreductase subunit NuoK [Planctomycetota bacterium]